MDAWAACLQQFSAELAGVREELQAAREQQANLARCEGAGACDIRHRVMHGDHAWGSHNLGNLAGEVWGRGRMG